MGAPGRIARRLSAGFAAALLLTFAAALAPQDAQAQAPVLTAKAGNAQVTLTWTGNNGINSRWQYRWKKGAGNYIGWTSISGGIGIRSHTVTGLTNNSAYTFQVRGHWNTIQGLDRSSGGPSNEVTATPVAPQTGPAAPVLTAATSTRTAWIDLTWTHAGTSVGDFVTGAETFDLWEANYRLKGASAWTSSLNRSSSGGISRRTRDLGINYPDGASVEVRIRARAFTTDTNSATVNGPWSNIRTVTFKNDDTAALTITGAPVTVEAGASASYTVALTQAYAGTLSITSSATAKATVDPATLTFSTTNYSTAQMVTMTGVEAGTAKINHAFRLTGAAADAIPDAGAVAVTVNAAAGPTVTLTAAPGDGQVTLSWTYTNDDGEAFDHWRYAQKKGGGSYSGLGDEIPGGKAIRTHTVTGLENDAAYTFKVSRGVSSPPPLRIQTTALPYSNEVTATPAGSPAVPAKPTGLSAEAGNAQVKLTWTDPDDDSITRYQLRQKKGSAAWGGWAAISGSDADTTSHTVTGLDNDVAYRFRIRARNSGGNSAPSAVVEATPAASAAVPKPVLSAEAGYARVTLSWSALSGVTVASWGYEYKSAGGSWSSTTPLSGLALLETLRLDRTGASDLMPLAGLVRLKTLNLLWNRQIVDLSPLSGLTLLETLCLDGIGASDLAPLAGLTRLETLTLSSNRQIVDLSPLSGLTMLRTLRLEHTGATDFSLLSAFTELRTLSLSGNGITDLSPLQALVKLSALHLGANRIEEVSLLADLTALRSLSLNDNRITDVTALAALPRLASLNLNGNPLSGFPSTGFRQLRGLYLRDCGVADIGALANLAQIETLFLDGNGIGDLTPLSSLSGLTKLFLARNAISDLTPLSQLAALRQLVLDDNDISDVSALSSLSGLTKLFLTRNEVSDLTPLSRLAELEQLTLGGNDVADVSALSGLRKLELLSLGQNQVADIAALATTR